MDRVAHIDVRRGHSLHIRGFTLAPLGVCCLMGSKLRVFSGPWQLTVLDTPTDPRARAWWLLTHALAILAATSVSSFGCRGILVVSLILGVAVLAGG